MAETSFFLSEVFASVIDFETSLESILVVISVFILDYLNSNLLALIFA